MSAKVPDLEQSRPEWTKILKKEFKAIRNSPALRKSEAPVSLLQFLVFSLQTTITALPDANASGKALKAGANLIAGMAKLAVTSDPRAVIQSATQIAGDAIDTAKRMHALFYAKQLMYCAIRPIQAKSLSLEEVSFLFHYFVFRPAADRCPCRFRIHGRK